MLRVVNSTLAESDLLEIWLYTAEEWNFSQADKFLAQIGSALQNLIEHLEMGKDRSDLKKGYRSLLVFHHIVFYRVVGDEFQIIRVIHESADLTKHF